MGEGARYPKHVIAYWWQGWLRQTGLRSTVEMETQPMPTTSSTRLEHKPVHVQAALAAATVFVLYLVTLAPSVTMWDTGEYMAATKVLGVPHQPGNPFFMM